MFIELIQVPRLSKGGSYGSYKEIIHRIIFSRKNTTQLFFNSKKLFLKGLHRRATKTKPFFILWTKLFYIKWV